MKTVIITAIIGLMMAFLPACKKSTINSLTTAQKVQNKWELVSEILNQHYSGMDHISTIPGSSSDIVEFRSDGKMYEESGGFRDTSSYFLTGDTKITIVSPYYSNTAYDIRTLTSSAFIVYNKEAAGGSDYNEETITLKR